jgi:membrane protein required for beta-lactamase induction
MNIIIYIIVLIILIRFWNKNKEKLQNYSINIPKNKKKREILNQNREGLAFDNKILGWIIVALIGIGFLLLGEDTHCRQTWFNIC